VPATWASALCRIISIEPTADKFLVVATRLFFISLAFGITALVAVLVVIKRIKMR
jgi:hypothetical protein